MKRFSIFFLSLLFILTLAACGGDRDKDKDPQNGDNGDPGQTPTTADIIIENWDGSLDYLTNVMNNMALSNDFEMTTELTLEQDFSEMFLSTSYNTDIRLTMHERYLKLMNGFVTETELVIVIPENLGMPISSPLSMKWILHQEGEVSTLYLHRDSIEFFPFQFMYVEDGLDVFFDELGVEEEWLKFSYSDSLDNLIEMEIIKEAIKALMIADIPELEDLDTIEEYLTLMIGVNQEQANLRLAELFDTLFTFDLNLVVAHLLDIDLKYVADHGLAYALGQILLDNMSSYSDDLMEELDYYLYYDLIMDEGLFTFFDEAPLEDLLIIESYLENLFPIMGFYDAYLEDDFTRGVILLALADEDVESELRSIEGFDYDEFISFIERFDLEELKSFAEIFDFNLFLDAFFEGRLLEFVEGMPDSELTKLIEMVLDMMIAEMGEAAILLEFGSLLEDLTRFEPFFSFDYLANQEHSDIELTKTQNNYLQTQMTMHHQMVRSMADSFFIEVWTWLNQAHSIHLPEIDPINCEGDHCMYWDEYANFFNRLEHHEPMVMLTTFNPDNPSTMWMHMDLTNMVDDPTLSKFELNMTLKDNTSIEIPTEAYALNYALERGGQWLLLHEIYDMLEELAYTVDIDYDVTFTLHDVLGEVYTSVLFSTELSTFILREDGDIEATLYYIDGKKVFTESTLSLYTLDAIAENVPEEILSYQLMLIFSTDETVNALFNLLDQDHFSLTRLLLHFFYYDFYDDDWDDWDDWNPPLNEYSSLYFPWAYSHDFMYVYEGSIDYISVAYDYDGYVVGAVFFGWHFDEERVASNDLLVVIDDWGFIIDYEINWSTYDPAFIDALMLDQYLWMTYDAFLDFAAEADETQTNNSFHIIFGAALEYFEYNLNMPR